MRIRKLELFGFKSFADRTDFAFDDGITCVVGPNGCGKSNIVDAVKWILGEQSARSLRGHEMSDVIFNGAAGRHPLGFAEATLMVDNASRRLPIDLSEVAITRRLYRSGESEYMINRKLCRLRDIRELFMDTGVGLNAYSLIEQGKVDVLLQSNPRERRAVFEEAAGISKYKVKKKEALRKLERTEQNLLRLSDIVEEVERRLRSVKYQAGKARNWQTYHDRLNELRIMHALNEYHSLSGQSAELAAQHERSQETRAGFEAAIRRLEAEQSELETALVELDDELRQADAELVNLRGQIAAAENTIAFNHTRTDEWHQTEARDRRRIRDLDGRLRDLDAQALDASAEAEAVASRLSHLRGELAATEEALGGAQRDVRHLADLLEKEKAAIMDLVQLVSQVRNDLSSVDLRSENLAASRRRLERRVTETAEQLQQLAEQESTIESEIADLDFAVQRDQQRLKVKRDEAERLNAEAREAATEMAAAKEYRSGLVSRRELLEDLEHRGEGLEEGVRRVLDLSREGLFPGIRGIVADLVDTDVRYATLIEAALGDGEQYIVIDRRQDVVDSLESLRETLDARAGFLPLDAMRQPAAVADAAGREGVVARAADLVRVDADLRPMVECLLGNTLLVEDLSVALRLSADGTLQGTRFVTMAGETVEPDGTMSLGRLTARAGLISRRSELRELDTQLVEVDGRIARFQDRSEGIAQRIHELDDQQRELRSVIYDASTVRVDLVAQKRRLGEMAEAVHTEQPVVASELDAVGREMAELAERRGELARHLEDLDEQAAQGRGRVAELGRRLTEAEGERARLEEVRTRQRVETAKVEEQRRGVEDRLGHLAAARNEAARQRDEAAEELTACGERIREAERTILQQESHIAELFLRKESVGRHCRQVGRRRQEGRDQAAGLHEQIRSEQARLHEVDQARHELDMQLAECRMKMQTLEERVREDFDLDLQARHQGYVPDEVDWDAVEEEIGQLRTRIERLGSVNLNAITEQEDLQQRAEFLRAQQKDLEEARRMLDRLIERINAESVTRFNATFVQVRENFQQLFRKLFGGGKADIVLLDPEDVLESGIEIVARPPGKEPCSISLLSGGEKTMTAVALLLAVFRSKPSPFCILDEVDAALDEANVERFNAVIRDFVQDSQFIMITHSKRSMAAADVLYGVTMQEPGVSTKISVRFADIHKIDLGDQVQSNQAAGL